MKSVPCSGGQYRLDRSKMAQRGHRPDRVLDLSPIDPGALRSVNFVRKIEVVIRHEIVSVNSMCRVSPYWRSTSLQFSLQSHRGLGVILRSLQYGQTL